MIQFQRPPVKHLSRTLPYFLVRLAPIHLITIALTTLLAMNLADLWIAMSAAAALIVISFLFAWVQTRTYLLGMRISPHSLEFQWLNGNESIIRSLPAAQVEMSIRPATWLQGRSLCIKDLKSGFLFLQKPIHDYRETDFSQILKMWRERGA